MKSFLLANKWRKCAAAAIQIILSVFCLMYLISCSPAPDPAFNAIKQVLIEGEDADTIYESFKANLDKVKDKQIVEILLNYLQGQRQQQEFDISAVRQVALYLERISGLKNRMEPMALVGPTYVNMKNWDKDISQWEAWWNADKDYIYWDEQAQSLTVKPH